MNNLNAHKNEGAIALILSYDQGVVFWAPYYQIDDAIEFIFNTIDYNSLAAFTLPDLCIMITLSCTTNRVWTFY